MGICQWSLDARAGDWTVNTGVGLSEQFTDNVNLVSKSAGRRADFITEVSPSVAVRGAGARASLDLDYSFSQLWFADRGDNDRIHDLTGRGQLEFWRQVGFIDATASMSRQVVNNQANFSNSLAGQTVNRADKRSVSVSPFFLHHLGPWADSELRFSYGHVSVESGVTPDTNEYGADLNFTSGRRFSRLRWTLRAHADWLERGSIATATPGATVNGDTSTVQVDYDVTYPLVRGVSLIGGAGYENIDDSTIGTQPDGATWRAGVQLDPTSRATLTATYGRRYADSNILVDANYQITSRTALHGSFTESLETNQQLFGRNLSFLGVDSAGNLIDTRTGLPFVVGNNAFGLQPGTFRQRVGFLGITTQRQRTNVALNASWESRKTETPAVREDIVRSVHLTAGRRLSRRTTGNIGFDYRNIAFGDGTGRKDNELTYSANLTYQIFRRTSAVIAFIRTRRNSNIDGNDLLENAATIRISQGF